VPDTAFQAACIHVLFEEFIDTYNTAPAVILIFMGETLMGQNNKIVAAEHFKMSLKYYPESVPLLVYRWQLTDDAAEKEQLYKKLKKEHLNHWMVQMMLK
jgi:amino acid permease